MKKLLYTSCKFLFLFWPIFVSAQTDMPLQAEAIKKHVDYLASDELEGRATGSQGGDKAAKYIAQQLEQFGVVPNNNSTSYFQNLPLHGTFPLSNCALDLFPEHYNYIIGQDYLLYKSGAQTYIPQPIDLVFVGYGIIAPEYDYNDYQSIDVNDKIVVYLSGEPQSQDSVYFNGTNPTIYSYPESKERLALSRGARGSILIPRPQEMELKSWDEWVRDFSFEDITLAYSAASHFSAIMKPHAALRLFKNAEYTLPQIFSQEKQNMLSSFYLPVKLSFHGEFKQREFTAANVIGVINGSDKELKETGIIITAHYDHLGIGKPVKGDSIYNGAVDNAIGTAMLLELANYFQQNKKTKRSLLFLFLTGEEKGLLGSTYYLDHPVFPHYKTIANINIDGAAIFDRFKSVVGIGAEYSTLNNILLKTTQPLNITVTSLPEQFLLTESFARSDQIAFAKAGIPSILIMDGLDYQNLSREQAMIKHLNWMQNIYHTPFDDTNQPINYSAVNQHFEILAHFIKNLANSENPPKWNNNSPFQNTRLQSIAEKR